MFSQNEEEYKYIDSESLSIIPLKSPKSDLDVVLCLYSIEKGCVLPFVKYIVTPKNQTSFSSFRIEKIVDDIDFDLYVKNQCFRRILSFIQNIHITALRFDKLFKGYLLLDKLYFFCDISGCNIYPHVKFGLMDEIIHSKDSNVRELFTHHSFLREIIDSSGKKVELPKLYFRDLLYKRETHPLYGDFFYFSKSIGKYRFAVFDCFAKTTEDFEPIHSPMFFFGEKSQCFLCVKHLMHFIQI
jgi:hypothetical protein